MIILKSIRWLIILLLVVTASFYLYLSSSRPDPRPFLITAYSGGGQPVLIHGDYGALIRVKDSVIQVSESLSFTQTQLDSALAEDLYGNTTVSSVWSDFEGLGWIRSPNPRGTINLKKEKLIPYRIGLWERTRNVAVPLLYTNEDLVGEVDHQEGEPETVLGEVVAKATYGTGLDYLPSENSQIKLVARRGLVQKTFPAATPEDILNTEDEEVFSYNPRQIGPIFQHDEELNTTTVNFQLLHPLYNNALGQLVKDWSAGKIIAWLFLSLVVLLSDKIKSLVLQPLVDKLFRRKKKEEKKDVNLDWL